MKLRDVKRVLLVVEVTSGFELKKATREIVLNVSNAYGSSGSIGERRYICEPGRVQQVDEEHVGV